MIDDLLRCKSASSDGAYECVLPVAHSGDHDYVCRRDVLGVAIECEPTDLEQSLQAIGNEYSSRPRAANRICITGGPRTGKTMLADRLYENHSWPHVGQDCEGCGVIHHTDDLIHLGWSEASQAACAWLDEPGPWIIEGVAVSRALRKWRDQHPGEPPPVDRVIYLFEPHEPLSNGQAAMAKGVATVHAEIEEWLAEHGVVTELT